MQQVLCTKEGANWSVAGYGPSRQNRYPYHEPRTQVHPAAIRPKGKHITSREHQFTEHLVREKKSTVQIAGLFVRYLTAIYRKLKRGHLRHLDFALREYFTTLFKAGNGVSLFVHAAQICPAELLSFHSATYLWPAQKAEEAIP